MSNFQCKDCFSLHHPPNASSTYRMCPVELNYVLVLRGHIVSQWTITSRYSSLTNACVLFIVQDYNDEIRHAQLQELTYLNGASEDAKVPAARGKTSTRARGTPAAGAHRCDSNFALKI